MEVEAVDQELLERVWHHRAGRRRASTALFWLLCVVAVLATMSFMLVGLLSL
jgi:hypothetical protein